MLHSRRARELVTLAKPVRRLFRDALQAIKPLLSTTLFRPGAIRTILWGPSRGLRYRIHPGYGLAPLYGGWEADAQRVMVAQIALGDVIYDVGANYGIHTLLMARLAGPQGRIFAFEPVATIRGWLRGNLKLNEFVNVSVVGLAVADQSGRAYFAGGHHAGAGHLQLPVESNSAGTLVSTVSIDDFVFAWGQPAPQLIKVDVEGAESRVLAGAARTLREHRPVLLVELHTPEQDVAVGRILATAGYVAYRTEDGSPVRDLSLGWPHPDGLWGQFIARMP